MILVLTLISSLSFASTCSSSVSSASYVTTDQYNFTGYSPTYTYGVAGGSVSKSLYYLYRLSSSSAAVRKVNVNGSQAWMAALGFTPILKSMTVDSAEQNVYFASNSNPIVVVCLATSNGSIFKQLIFTGINGVNLADLKIFPLSDSSGYYFIGKDSSTTAATLCKYIFSPSSAQCQPVTGINTGYGHLMLSDTQFFLLGVDNSYQLQMYKITFGSTSVNWANKIICPSLPCGASNSESYQSLDGTTIYSLFTYGNSTTPTYYLYFASLSVASGSVMATRYKSSISIKLVYGGIFNGDYIVAMVHVAYYLVIYNISSSSFTIKSYSGAPTFYLYGGAVEPSSGRFIVNGMKSNYGYTTKFVFESIGNNTDFTASSLLMNSLSTGTDDIIPESSMTISTLNASYSPASGSYANQTVVYVQGTTVTSDVYYQITSQSISIIEANTATFTLDLSCSSSGSTSIIYSIGNYGSTTAPSWATINSSSGVLTITAPNVSVDTEFDFYAVSTVTGASNPVQKLVKLTVANCLVSNCQVCSSSSTSICTACNSGYNLNSGVCNVIIPEVIIQKSEVITSTTSQSLGTTLSGIVGSTFVIATITSLMNSTTMASVWSMINQMQMLFLFFLTRVYLPEDVKTIIKGPKFTINVYNYIPISNIKFFSVIFIKFDLDLTNPLLSDVGVNSDSSIYNIYPMLGCLFLVIMLHICLLFLIWCALRVKKTCCCNCLMNVAKVILNKLYTTMTFGFYIRNALQMSLFVLIFAVYELYKFNTDGIFCLISIAFSFLLLWFYLVFAFATLYLLLTSYKTDENRHNMFGEFFSGIKQSKQARFYVIIFLIRKATFVVLLLTLTSISSKIVIGILEIIQFVYLIYIICLRPFAEIKVNMIEIVNESYYLLLMFALIFLTNESNWNSTITSVFMWVISSNSMIAFLIVCVDSIIMFIRWLVKKCSKPRPTRIAPKPSLVTIEPNETVNVKGSKLTRNQVIVGHQNKAQNPSVFQLHEESKIDYIEDISDVKIFKMKDWS